MDMGLSFNDLDVSLQRAVFSASAILCIILLLCLQKYVHYGFIVLTLVASVYTGYLLFIKPLKGKGKKK